MSRQAAIPVLFALSAAFLFGSAPPASKILLDGIEPISCAALIYLGAGIGMTIYWGAGWMAGSRRRKMESPLTRSDLPWIAVSVLSGSVAATILLMFSLQVTPATTASLLMSFEAVATTLIAIVLFREPVGRKFWSALVLVVGGCIALSWEPGSLYGFSIGALGILAATVCWGLGNNLNQVLSVKDPVGVVVLKGWSAGLIILPLAILAGETAPALPAAVAAMVIGFICFGGLMAICFLRALRGLGAARAGSLFATNPLFGVVISFAIFRDVPNMLFFAAVPLMVLGIWLLVTEEHRHGHTHPAQVHEHRHRHDDGHHDHDHQNGEPPIDRWGYHSHLHAHEPHTHDHPHHPDIHHRHEH